MPIIPAREEALTAGSTENVAGLASSSTSGLTLGESNMMEGGHDQVHHQTEMASSDDGERLPGDELESKSGNHDYHEGTSAGDHHRSNRKRYHRHTQRHIQEMEAFFKECPHPDEKQRRELGRELGLEPLQVKFWFQNKRTQMKTQHKRRENSHLRAEYEKLRGENMRYREALSNASCATCGRPTAIGEMSFGEHQLRVENTRLREEIDRISAIAAKYVGKPFSSNSLFSPPVTPRSSLDHGAGTYGAQPSIESDMFWAGGDLFRTLKVPTEAEKPLIIELAVTAMEELIRMAQIGDPLWLPSTDRATTVLSEDEYFRAFPGGIGPKLVGFRTEASKETAVMMTNHVNIVEILMNVNQWSTVFSSIVSRAATLDVLSTGVAGNYDGALQVMSTEFQVPSPLVPTRESCFTRYCKQHADGRWAVVDVSIDSLLRPGLLVRCRRRPSGCIIQEMPDGCSKVTWIEHVEVDDRGVHHIYKPLVNAALAFGAKRWVSTLDRQCQRLASAMSTNLPSNNLSNDMVITSQEGRKSVLKLAARMVSSYCGGVSASTTHSWTTLSGSGLDDVRVMTSKSVDHPGRPPGIVLSAATSFWLPLPPKRVFDFLRDETNRNEWDILSNGGGVQEMAHIANGREIGNCVSLLRVNSSNSSQSNMLILQESCTDSTASYVVYAPIDIVAMKVVLNGGDPDYVALLPSGFAILPDGPAGRGGGNGEAATGGSLITVAFQILVDSVPTAKLSLGSVATVNNLIACTIDRIKASVKPDSA